MDQSFLPSSNNKSDDKECRRALMAVERLLKIRIRSEHELKEKLIEKNFSSPTIDHIIRHYAKLGLVDDQMFCRQWILSRLRRPFGKHRIRLELLKKGIAKELINEQLSTVCQEQDEESVVLDLATRRASKYGVDDRQKIRQKVYAYLTRRGFNSGPIMKAIKTL